MGFSYIRSSNPNCKEISLLYDKMPTIALFHWSQQDETKKQYLLSQSRNRFRIFFQNHFAFISSGGNGEVSPFMKGSLKRV